MTPGEQQLESFKIYFLRCLWRAYGRLWLIAFFISLLLLVYRLSDPTGFAMNFPCWDSQEGQLVDPPWVMNPYYSNPCTQGQVPWMLWITLFVVGVTVVYYWGKWLQALENWLSFRLWGSEPAG